MRLDRIVFRLEVEWMHEHDEYSIGFFYILISILFHSILLPSAAINPQSDREHFAWNTRFPVSCALVPKTKKEIFIGNVCNV